jgi:hypothetical protein
MPCPYCYSSRSPITNNRHHWCLDCQRGWIGSYNLMEAHKGNKVAIANGKGELLTGFDYDSWISTNKTSNNFIHVYQNCKVSLVNQDGKQLFPFLYDQVSFPVEGLIAVRKGLSWGYINTVGKEVIPFQYQYTWCFSEGLAFVFRNYLAGYIDKSGVEIIPCKYLDAKNFSEGLAAVQSGLYYGYINREGDEIIPFEYDEAEPFKFGLAIVASDELYGCIDRNNRKIIPLIYDGISRVSDEYFYAYGSGKHYLIDHQGKKHRVERNVDALLSGHFVNEVPDASTIYTDYHYPNGLMQYQIIEPFIYGFAPARLNNRWGVIDNSGNQIIPCIYDEVFYFDNRCITVKLDGKEGLTDIHHQFILPLEFDEISTPDELGVLEVTKNGKKGFMNLNGEIVIPLVYSDIDTDSFCENGLAICYDEEYGYFINRQGEVIEVFDI